MDVSGALVSGTEDSITLVSIATDAWVSEDEVVLSVPDGAGILHDERANAAVITTARTDILILFITFSCNRLPAGGYTVSSMYLLLILIHVLIRPFEDIFK